VFVGVHSPFNATTEQAGFTVYVVGFTVYFLRVKRVCVHVNPGGQCSILGYTLSCLIVERLESFSFSAVLATRGRASSHAGFQFATVHVDSQPIVYSLQFANVHT